MAEQKYAEEPLHGSRPGAAIENPGVEFRINGRPSFATVSVELKPGQRVVADGGTMMWMDADVDVALTCAGGCIAACMRSWAGESCYFEKYTGPGHVTFGFDTPGDILPFVATPGNGWVLTKGAFIAGTEDLTISSRFFGCCAGAVDESPFLVKVTTREQLGLFFAGNFGEIVRHEVPPGKTLLVDNGLFFGAHEKTALRMQVFGGIKTCCCGGEGIVMAFHGPAVVYTQSRDPELWLAAMQPPSKDVNPSGGGGDGGQPPQE